MCFFALSFQVALRIKARFRAGPGKVGERLPIVVLPPDAPEPQPQPQADTRMPQTKKKKSTTKPIPGPGQSPNPSPGTAGTPELASGARIGDSGANGKVLLTDL